LIRQPSSLHHNSSHCLKYQFSHKHPLQRGPPQAPSAVNRKPPSQLQRYQKALDYNRSPCSTDEAFREENDQHKKEAVTIASTFLEASIPCPPASPCSCPLVLLWHQHPSPEFKALTCQLSKTDNRSVLGHVPHYSSEKKKNQKWPASSVCYILLKELALFYGYHLSAFAQECS
jgi:hypothetical protein